MTKEEELYRELNELKILYKITALFLEEESSLQTILQKSAEIINSYWESGSPDQVVIKYSDFVAASDDSRRIEENSTPLIAVKFNDSPFGEMRIYRQKKDTVTADNSSEARELTGQEEDFLKSIGHKLSILVLNKERQERRKNSSYQDTLTSLYNRRFFQKEVERLDTERQLPISFIMLDVNGLKLINDGFGHKFGDQVLKRTASILQNSVRAEDIIARWGGDEFLIMLPQTNKKQAEKIGTRIEELCRETVEEKIPISLGMGIASKESIEENINEVLNLADENMYINKYNKSSSSEQLMIAAMIKHLAQKSDETEGHIVRITNCLHKLGQKLGLSNYQLDELYLLAQLHDIGNIYIPEKVLRKPGELSRSEWELIKMHPEKGYKLALGTDRFSHVADAVYSHHERWDGEGYPRGLRGKEIPLLARIFAVVDAFDVMTSSRCYSPVKSHVESVQELEAKAGSQFDPGIVDKFISLILGEPD